MLLFIIYELKMQKQLNIPSYVTDPNYRYKMPGLITRVEGRGGGIKTNLINLTYVAAALRVPTDYPLKFLGHELCAASEHNF